MPHPTPSRETAEIAEQGKHTPGPWKAFHQNGKHVQADKWSVDHEDAGSLSYAPIKAGNEVVAFAVSRSARTMAAHDVAPNCHLIAASPELLAALRIAVRQNSHDMLMTGEELRQCEAAIARATGDQQS